MLHAWNVPHVGYDPQAAARLDPHDFETTARNRLDELVDAEDTSGIGDLRRSTARGAPAAAILEAARAADASLVVVGTRGHGRLKRILLGSTANQVAHHAPCPVVIVPSDRR